MAHAITHITAPSRIASVFQTLWTTLCWLGENSARARMIRELSALSDAELEAKGLTRQDIVRRVFDDGYYL